MGIDDEFVNNWDLITKYLGEHVNRVNDIFICSDLGDNHNMPPQLKSFVPQLLKNSQTTLQVLSFDKLELIDVDMVLLPNLSKFQICMEPNYDQIISKFDKLIKNIMSNCNNLKEFRILDLPICPNIMHHLKQNYAK